MTSLVLVLVIVGGTLVFVLAVLAIVLVVYLKMRPSKPFYVESVRPDIPFEITLHPPAAGEITPWLFYDLTAEVEHTAMPGARRILHEYIGLEAQVYRNGTQVGSLAMYDGGDCPAEKRTKGIAIDVHRYDTTDPGVSRATRPLEPIRVETTASQIVIRGVVKIGAKTQAKQIELRFSMK